MEHESYYEHVKNLKAVTLLQNNEFIRAGFFPIIQSRENIVKDKYTLLYVIEGEGKYLIGSNSVSLTPGSLIMRRPGVEHSIYRNKDKAWLEFFIVIHDVLYSFLDKSGVLPADESFIPVTVSWLNNLEKLTLELQNLSHRKRHRCSLKVHEFFILLREEMQAKRKTVPGREDIISVCKKIDEDPSLRISNQDLAEKAGYGLEHFRKLFRDITGCPPQDYIIRSRIEKAQRLILNGETQMEKIAMELGYQDLPSFSRQFKKNTGISPTGYRRQIMDS